MNTYLILDETDKSAWIEAINMRGAIERFEQAHPNLLWKKCQNTESGDHEEVLSYNDYKRIIEFEEKYELPARDEMLKGLITNVKIEEIEFVPNGEL